MGRFKCSLFDAAYPGTSGQNVPGRGASDKSVYLTLFCRCTDSRLRYVSKQADWSAATLLIADEIRAITPPPVLKGTYNVSATASVIKPTRMLPCLRTESLWRTNTNRQVSSPLPKCTLPDGRFRRSLENSIGLHSQNVQGIPKDPLHCAHWFSNFRQHDERRPLDIVMIQETHVSYGEAHGLDSLYCATWGFNSVEKRGLKLWSESSIRRGVLQYYLTHTKQFRR